PAPVILPLRLGGGTRALVVVDPNTGALDFILAPFGLHYHGSLRVTSGDVNGDGTPDVIVTTGHGSGKLRVFDGVTGLALPGALGNLNPFGGAFTGGLFAFATDVNHDGFMDVIVAATVNGRRRFKLYSGLTGAFFL